MSEFSIKKKVQIFRKHQIMGRCVSDWQGQIIVNSMQSLPIHYRQQGEWGVNLNLSVDMLNIMFKYKVRKKPCIEIQSKFRFVIYMYIS